MVLVYPVISFESPYGHMGSAHNQLGPTPEPEKIRDYSNVQQVANNTPPAFLVHAKDDDAVPFVNSTLFDEALKKHHIPENIYLYEKGGHGFGMKNLTSTVLWMDLVIHWILKL